jgi:hypothetical protein
MILAIDPGCVESGYVILDREYKPHHHGVIKNEELLGIIENSSDYEVDTVVIEMMTSYGMPIGKTSMDTLVWIGRFFQEVPFANVFLMARSKIKTHLCNSMRAKDKNIAVAVKDRYTPSGGGSDPYKGTKKSPGPLYGFKSHTFAALAVAITYLENPDLIYDMYR